MNELDARAASSGTAEAETGGIGASLVAAIRSSGLLGVARWATVAWGALHVLGGALIIQTVVADGGQVALEDLGSGAAAGAIPSDPGPVVEAVVGFHGLNIVFFGLAVLVLARRRRVGSLRDAMFVMAAADIGLLVFLLLPGYMSWSEGIWGPALLVIAASAFVFSSRREAGASANG